jgi:hypothetical protein
MQSSQGFRPPIILLKEGTDTSQGRGQLVSNINATMAIVEIVRTTLGREWSTTTTLSLFVLNPPPPPPPPPPPRPSRPSPVSSSSIPFSSSSAASSAICPAPPPARAGFLERPRRPNTPPVGVFVLCAPRTAPKEEEEDPPPSLHFLWLWRAGDSFC